MNKLISAEALLLSVRDDPEINGKNFARVKEHIDNAQDAVKHGRWLPHYETFDADMAVGILGGNYQTGWQCSVCGRYECAKEPYCNCGARMDGENDG